VRQEQQSREERISEVRRSGFANLPHSWNSYEFRTFDNYKGVAADKASDFCSSIGAHTLVVLGPVGTGKSHLLEAIGRRCLSLPRLSVKYIVASELIRHIWEAINNREACGSLSECHDCDVLLLDDLGAEYAADPVRDKLTNLVDQRYSYGKRMAVATNLSRAEMAERLGDRIASRLFDVATGHVTQVVLRGQDHRA